MRAIAGACAYMALFQKQVAAAVRILVGLSSLLQIPLIHAVCGGTAGVIAAKSTTLTPAHFANCSVADTFRAWCTAWRTLPSSARRSCRKREAWTVP